MRSERLSCVFIWSVFIEHLLDAYPLLGIQDTMVNKTGVSALQSVDSPRSRMCRALAEHQGLATAPFTSQHLLLHIRELPPIGGVRGMQASA